MKKALMFDFLPSVKGKSQHVKSEIEANNIEESRNEAGNQSESEIKLPEKFSDEDDKKIITLFDEFKCCDRIAQDFFPNRRSREIRLRYRILTKYENQMSELYQMMCQSLILDYRNKESLSTWDNINKLDLEKKFNEEFLLEFYQKLWKHRIVKTEFSQREMNMLREYRENNLVLPAKSEKGEKMKLKRIGCSVNKVLQRMSYGLDVFQYLYWKGPQLDLESERLLIEIMEGPKILFNAKKKKQAEMKLKMSAKVWPLEYCRIKSGCWSEREDRLLIKLAKNIKYQRDIQSWKQIEHKFPNKTYESIYFRRIFLDKEWTLVESCDILSLLNKHELIKCIIPEVNPKHNPYSVYLHLNQMQLLYRRSKNLSKIAESLIYKSNKDKNCTVVSSHKQARNQQQEQQLQNSEGEDESSSGEKSIHFNDYVSRFNTQRQKEQRKDSD